MQGEGGCTPGQATFLSGLRELCDAAGALLVFDEVQCGLGRTGKLWGYEHYGVEPDLMTLAKPLAGGLPIGAVLLKEHVADAMKPGEGLLVAEGRGWGLGWGSTARQGQGDPQEPAHGSRGAALQGAAGNVSAAQACRGWRYAASGATPSFAPPSSHPQTSLPPPPTPPHTHRDAGDHGSTFAGNPLVCATAGTVLDIIAEPSFLDSIEAKGERLRAGLRKATASNPHVQEVRGLGLLVGVQLDVSASKAVEAARAEGLIIITAGKGDVVRLVPPLVITNEEIDEAVVKLAAVLARLDEL